MQIPIRNIYYLLCYAWNKLESKDTISVSIDDRTELLDLFSMILINTTRILLKRGIDKSYVYYSENIPGIKGKLENEDTIKKNLLDKFRTQCSFDEFSENIITNRILVSTLIKLIRTIGLSKTHKMEIKKLLSMLPGVFPLELNNSMFNRVKINRNNRIYSFIINVCRLIFENSLPSEEPGKWKFVDFTRNEKRMNQLFEAFIFQFYRCEQKEWKVFREIIDWKFDLKQNYDLNFLPIMRTDITLINHYQKVIIDAKFYKETMVIHYDKSKLHSNHLYQLFSYLVNQEDGTEQTAKATGILLYPTIDTEYDLSYNYKDHKILIKTIDLNKNPENISKRLKEIIQLS